MQSFTAWFNPTRVWETAKRTTRQANTDADGERLCCELWTLLGCRSSSCNSLSPQVLESSPCWSGRSTKTAWWWWSSSVLLWDATLWSFLQVRCLPNNLSFMPQKITKNIFTCSLSSNFPVVCNHYSLFNGMGAFIKNLFIKTLFVLFRVDWWGRKRRSLCTEGAKRRNWLQRGSGRSHPRYV